MFSNVEAILSSPEIGRVVPEIGDSHFREFLYGNYRIIYKIDHNQILILTIRHVKQLLPVGEIIA